MRAVTADAQRATRRPAARATLLVARARSSRRARVAARRRGAVILPATTIDGPSEDIVGFGGVAMAEDGTGGLVYLKRVDGVAHVFVSRYAEGHWLRADPGRQRTAVRRQLAAHRRGRRRRAGRRVGDAVRDRKRHARSTSCSARRSAPARRHSARAMIVDPDIRDGTGHEPRPRDELDRPGRRRLPRRAQRTQGQPSNIPLLRPGDVVEDVRVAHFNGERWSPLGAINRNPGVSMRPPTRGQRAADRDRPDRQRDRRLAGARHRTASRASGRGACSARASTTCCRSARELRRRADRRRRRRAERRDLAARPGRGRLPAGRRTRLAAAGAAHLPEHAARRRIGRTARSSRRERSPTRAVAGGAGAAVGPPSIDIDEKQDMRLLYDANGTPRVIEGNDRGLSARALARARRSPARNRSPRA